MLFSLSLYYDIYFLLWSAPSYISNCYFCHCVADLGFATFKQLLYLIPLYFNPFYLFLSHSIVTFFV